MAKIATTSFLIQDTEVVIATGAKTIQLLVAGNLDNTSPGSTSGVTLQAVYSFLKEQWKLDNALNKFKFPLKMFTKTDGIFINGWVFADATSRNLVRDGGWTEGASQYAGIISLGAFDNDLDQAYYQQVLGYDVDVATSDFNKTGNLNEAIDVTGKTSYLKSFLRIQGKIYSEYNLLGEQGIAALEPVLYRLPLSNTPDLKISTDDGILATGSAFADLKINYLLGVGFETYADTTAYPSSSVVKDNTNRWFYTLNGGTTSGANTGADVGVTDWAPYDGEVQIGSNYFAFNRILSGSDQTDLSIYNWAQWKLRTTGSINDQGTPTANQRYVDVISGSVAELLLEYVGDTLKTKPGLYITGFNAASTNNITFRDITVDGGGVDSITFLPVVSTERAYPFIAQGIINFSSNLVNEEDVDTKYAMYFDSTPTGAFDSSTAVLVQGNAGNVVSGSITGASLAFDFDYDFNTQGGRTQGTDAAVSVVAQGLGGATWVLTNYTITRAGNQTITVGADDERNYVT
jgi:hypothetical protein